MTSPNRPVSGQPSTRRGSAPRGFPRKGQILLVAVGGGNEWVSLREHLQGSGWNVTPEAMATIIEQGGPAAALSEPALFDFAILVVEKPQGHSDLRATRALLHLAGMLQGRLGANRVLVVVEDQVDALLAGTGVPEIAYSAGNMAATHQRIATALKAVDEKPRGRLLTGFDLWRAQTGLEDVRVAAEVWMWAAAILILILVSIFTFLLLDDPLSSDAAVDVVAVGEKTGVAGPIIVTEPSTIPPALGTTLPSGGGGRGDTLPAACTISTGRDIVIASQIACDEGGLIADGFLGPWYNQVSAVSADPGVVGEVVIEPRRGVTEPTRVRLSSGGRIELEPYDSLFGVQQVVLEFSANNQKVVFHQSPGRGGEEMTLTYRLDL